MGFGQVDNKIIKQLQDIVSPEAVLTKDFQVVSYAKDHTNPSPPPRLPFVVVLPQTTEQVSKILRIANNNRIPVTPVGGLTGISGGAIPKFGGIVIDCRRMDKIVEVDEENMVVTCQAGITIKRLNDFLKEYG